MLRLTEILARLSRHLDGLVHGSAAGDALLAARHRSFIGAHLSAGLLALAAIPVWLASGAPAAEAAPIAFLFLAAPLAVAAFLSRTGRLDHAHLASSSAFAALIAWAATATGGPLSPALAWLAVIPLEAALAGSRRTTIAAGGIALFAFLAVLAAAASGFTPIDAIELGLVGPVITAGAIVYGGALALRLDSLGRQTEIAARTGEARYRLLADSLDHLITLHGPSGGVDYASPASRSLLGVAPGALSGGGLFEHVHVADRPAFLNAISEADRTGGTTAAEIRLKTAAGVVIETEMRARPMLDGDGARRVVAVIRDVSQEKVQHEKLAEAQRAAETANAAKSRFLANVSHELRTPLNAIIGFSDMMKQEVGRPLDDAKRREYATLIHASGEHLLQLVNGILDMSKIEAGGFEIEPERLALGPVVDGAVELIAHQAHQRGVLIRRQIAAGLPEVLADRRACRQIVLNLVSNAVKFSHSGGAIVVSAQACREGVTVAVSDSGIGIAAEDIPRLGTPFLQVDSTYNRRFEGTGLGLSIVKGLVELHSGSLTIESELGRGTTVRVTLPAAPAKGRSVSASEGRVRRRA